MLSGWSSDRNGFWFVKPLFGYRRVIGVCAIREQTSAYISIRQNTSAYVSILSIRQHTSAYVRIHQHTSAYVVKALFGTAESVSIRQHTSAYVSIHTHIHTYVTVCMYVCIYIHIYKNTPIHIYLKRHLTTLESKSAIVSGTR